MTNTKKTDVDQDGFEKFKELTRKLVSVPKKEIEEQAKKFKRRQVKKRRTSRTLNKRRIKSDRS